ncbi:MAG: tripartite tricarboxylate transporter substrate binding protein [Advenella sp.]|uniref:tripartite tricarboxylate transporter substrate binding protein n=1 Tax=Advenella sp. TaxID=1872388 RepID=UPI003F9CC6F9
MDSLVSPTEENNMGMSMWAARFGKVSICTSVVCAFLTAGVSQAQQADAHKWRPGNGEFIVPAGPGGAVDTAARMISRLLQKEKLYPNLVVVNNPGGNTAIALNALDKHKGDGNYVMTSASSIMNHEILGNIHHRMSDYTEIAILFDEYVGVAVRADSPYKTIHDLIAKFKASPDALNVGVATAIGNHIHVGLAGPLKEAGVDISKMTMVPYKSSSESITALQGGHLDVVAATTPNLVGLVKSGAIRVLAIGAPERLSEPFENVPTWIEEGIDAVLSSAQGVMGPRNMPKEQLDVWAQMLATIAATDEWKAFLAKNHWKEHYLGPEATREYRAGEYKQIRSVLTELGLVKK